MNNTAELVRLKEEQLRLSQSKREHENKLSAILALIRKEGRMTREKYQQCCDAQIRHKQGIKRVDEMISSVKIKIFELSQLENQNKQSMERRLVDLERENAELRNEIARLNNQTNWVCKCGGTDCEGQKENAALREALVNADELERYSGSDGHRQWGKCSAWLHPDDAVIIVSAKALDAVRKEAQP